MSFDKSQFFQVFYEETGEHLTEMEELMLNLDIGAPNQEDLDAIFRAVHSIKGGAGTFGFTEMTEVAHIFESVLDRVRKGTMSLTSEMVDLFLESGDILNGLLAGYRDGATVDTKAVSGAGKKLKKLLEEAPETIEKKEDIPKSELTFTSQTDEEEDPGFGFFNDLPEVGETEGERGEEIEIKAEAEIASKEEQEAQERIEAQDKIEKEQGYGFFEKPRSEEPGRRASDVVEASGEPVRAGRRESDKVALPIKAHSESASIRIDVEKIDQVFNQVGEIVIAQAMLSQTASDLDPDAYEKLKDGLAELERNTRNLQESVMSIRMVPVRMVFNRFPRLIRDMRRKFNKELELVMVGEDTEIDKGFVEKLVDPLTHLIRNSFDHGIESPETRRENGKDPKGTITLQASHSGGNVVIEVRDDGAGMDRKRILAKAEEKGIPVSEEISDKEVWNLIFSPGFSTAKQVSALSGRGVGMDVVKKNVQAMGGHVDIESEKNVGSRFIIRLPLTLAIIEGMIVRVGKEVYVLPLISIVESIRPLSEDVRSIMGKGELVNMRGEYLPVVRLYNLFSTMPDTTDPTRAVLVVIESEGGKVAVMVDELLGQQQVVIKSLEQNFRKVPGVAGATILGDGHVAFILDVRGLLAFSREEGMLVG